jgi:predicted O-methyltransferase YrrM
MKQTIKRTAKALVKTTLTTAIGRRVISFIAGVRTSYLRSLVEPHLTQTVFTTSKVLNGPFKGMTFPYRDWPKLLGSYEDELHEVIELICDRGYEQIVDVGAAEGYYVVGFALRNPAAKIIAYEMDTERHASCQENATINGVQGRIELKGRCDVGDLAALDFSKKTLIFSDCEGFERYLLDPERVRGLKQADLLVETHDVLVAGVSETIRKRFLPTHQLAVYLEERKDHKRYPQIKGLSPFEQEVSMSEDRISAEAPGRMEWFYLTARS